MPVVGHAFVGLATGLCVAPDRGAGRRPVYWMPFVVAAAYLPDIANQIAVLAGCSGARAVTHSLLFALAVSPILAVGARGLTGVGLKRAFVVTFLTIVVHDVLDLMQGTDHRILWPLHLGPYQHGFEIIPSDPRVEEMVFAGAFALFVVGRWIVVRGVGSQYVPEPAPGGRERWVGFVLFAVIVCSAWVTHHLRGEREDALRLVREFLGAGQYEEALAACDLAERWPSTARAGRVAYAQAEAHLGLGHREEAERFYRQAYDADPDFFWVVADLAGFYAGGGGSVEQRRVAAGPFIDRLDRQFVGHPDYARMRGKIGRRLER